MVFCWTAVFAANSFAADCRILGVREVPGSAAGLLADFEITVSGVNLPAGNFFFQGQESKDGAWKSWPIRAEGNNGAATISRWKSGDPIKFSYGRGSGWTDPMCSGYRYPLNARPEDTHFLAVLGEPKKISMPWIAMLLLDGSEQLKVISIDEFNVNGPTAYYRITFGLETVPVGLPFFMAQLYKDGPWVSYGVKDNGDKTATAVIPNWNRGVFCEFLFGTATGSKQYLVDPSGSPYKFGGHFGALLGQAQMCSINDENDPLVRRITNLGGGVYRIYLNFPMEEGFDSLFVQGQVSPNNTWVSWPVKGSYPCYYVDLSWPYNGTFHFSFGIIKLDGTTERWVDPTLSKFECLDHLCITPVLY